MNSDLSRQLSWRDPSGFVVREGERILRAVVPEDAQRLDDLMEMQWYQRHVENGSIPDSCWLPEPPRDFPRGERYRWIEHRVLAFPSYPHEITALQLYDAARLTLDIAREALAHGWMLKDASAWNVLFDRGRPVFCDVLSLVPLDNSGLWPAYAQACRHFIIPLLLHRHLGVEPARLFLTRPDGMPPEQAYPMLGTLSTWRQPALETVTLPALLGRRGRNGAAALPRPAQDRELARHLVGRTLDRLDKHLRALQPTVRKSTWGDYETQRPHYSETDLASKRDFVRRALRDTRVRSVLDLGCNAGEFSTIAADLGKRVLATDADHGALTRLYSALRKDPSAADISPALLNLGRPTPAVGWLNIEIPGIIQRARGRFDCVMALGLIHHLMVTERATLNMVLELFKAFDPAMLIVEWIGPGDSRLREIAGPNLGLYAHMDAREFEDVFSTAYRCTDKTVLDGGRALYVWHRRDSQVD